MMMLLLNNKLSSVLLRLVVVTASSSSSSASRRRIIVNTSSRQRRFIVLSSISISISNDSDGVISGSQQQRQRRRIRSFSSSSSSSSTSFSSSLSSSPPPAATAPPSTPPSDIDIDTAHLTTATTTATTTPKKKEKKKTTKTTKLISFWPKKIIDVDSTWERLQKEAYHVLEETSTTTTTTTSSSSSSFGLKELIEERILSHNTFIDGLSGIIGTKLSSGNNNNGNDPMDYKGMALEAMKNDSTIAESACADLDRFLIMDPAADYMLKIFLFFKGYHAVQCARIAHYFWMLQQHQQEHNNNNNNNKENKNKNNPSNINKWIASALQSDMSDKFGVDIHPGAKWGKGITMDHGTGCVVGETAVIGDNVYLMHGVTLGATGRESDDDDDHNRHPKIGRGAFLAANSTILGNITIGDGAVVGASSLVIKDVPAGGYTAVGIPARLIPPPSSHSTRNQKLRVAPSGTKMPASEYSYDFGGDGSNNGSNSDGDGDGDGDGGDHYNKGGHGMGI